MAAMITKGAIIWLGNALCLGLLLFMIAKMLIIKKKELHTLEALLDAQKKGLVSRDLISPLIECSKSQTAMEIFLGTAKSFYLAYRSTGSDILYVKGIDFHSDLPSSITYNEKFYKINEGDTDLMSRSAEYYFLREFEIMLPKNCGNAEHFYLGGLEYQVLSKNVGAR